MPIATVISVFAQRFKAGLSAVQTTPSCHQKSRVVWEITGFTSIKLQQPPSDWQGWLPTRTNGVISGCGRTRGYVRNTFSEMRQGGKLPSSLTAASIFPSAQDGIRDFSSKSFLCAATLSFLQHLHQVVNCQITITPITANTKTLGSAVPQALLRTLSFLLLKY